MRRVSVAVEEVRENLTRRLEEVEGAGLSEEDMARVFAEEMDKSVENTSSVLWVWLSKVSCIHTCTCTLYMYTYKCMYTVHTYMYVYMFVVTCVHSAA